MCSARTNVLALDGGGIEDGKMGSPAGVLSGGAECCALVPPVTRTPRASSNSFRVRAAVSGGATIARSRPIDA